MMRIWIPVLFVLCSCRATTSSLVKDTSTWTEDNEDVCELVKQRTGMLYGTNVQAMPQGFVKLKAAEATALKRTYEQYLGNYNELVAQNEDYQRRIREILGQGWAPGDRITQSDIDRDAPGAPSAPETQTFKDNAPNQPPPDSQQPFRSIGFKHGFKLQPICVDENPECLAIDEWRVKVAQYQAKRETLDSCTWSAADDGYATMAIETETQFGLDDSTNSIRSNLVNLITEATNVRALCSIVGPLVEDWRTRQGDSRAVCQGAVVANLCNGIITAGTGQIKEHITDGEVRARAMSTVSRSVTSTIIQCITAEAMENLQDKIQQNLNGRMKAALLAGLCNAGGKILADVVDSAPDTDLRNACEFNWDRHRVASCLRTGASACSAAMGGANIRNLLPDSATEHDIAHAISEVANAGLSSACQLGGQATNVLCGTISEAAGQIKKAIMNGDNDWARCVGTTQAGQCVGRMWTEWNLGYNVAEAASQPLARPVKYGEGADDWNILCCLCTRTYYKSVVGWDTYLMSEKTAFPTEPERPSSCPGMYYGKGELPPNPPYEYHEGKRVYYKYTKCYRQWVKGRYCPFRPAGLYSKPESAMAASGTYYAWDNVGGETIWDDEETRDRFRWVKWPFGTYYYNSEVFDEGPYTRQD